MVLESLKAFNDCILYLESVRRQQKQISLFFVEDIEQAQRFFQSM